MTDQPDLAALIGSRICHDLISPIGAIGNGVELLQMGPGDKSPELALIADSVAHASARIRFFRLAFGTAESEAQVARAEIEAVLIGLFHGTRIVLSLATPNVLPRTEVKLAFLGLQCLESALPFGGSVHLGRDPRGWVLTGTSRRIKIDADLWGILGDNASFTGIGPAQVQFALLREEARRQARRLSVDVGADEVRISF